MPADRCPTCDRPTCPMLQPTEHIDVGRDDCPACVARDNCAAHRVDWRARALAAESELAGASAAICDVTTTIRGALAGHGEGMHAPYHGPLAAAVRYPSIASDLRRLDEVLTIGSPRAVAMRDDAAKWRRVEPLIERLREAMESDHCQSLDPAVGGAIDELLAATKEPP